MKKVEFLLDDGSSKKVEFMLNAEEYIETINSTNYILGSSMKKGKDKEIYFIGNNALDLVF